MPAVPPTAVVTEIPGRYSPTYVKNRTNPTAITTSTPTSSVDKFLARFEQANLDFNTPLTEVDEVGTNFHVGQFADLPDSKVSFNGYDVGLTNLAAITGTQILTPGTTIIGYSQLANAIVDITKQYADPNGNVFYTEYLDNLFIDDFSISLKYKAAAMESYSFVGASFLGFRGAIQTKAYVVQAADVTANSFSVASILGPSEAVIPLPVPGGGLPASYWIQRGSLNFVKIERYRLATGWVTYPEVTSAPVAGQTKFTSPTLSFAAGDLTAGDLFFLTYCTYKTNAQTIIPLTPGTSTTAGGTLAATTYYVKTTYTNAAGESLPSPEATQVAAINTVLNVTSPPAATGATGYNVYVSNTAGGGSGAETRQNGTTPIAIGTPWVEPTTGLVSGSALPTANTTGLLGLGAIYQTTPDLVTSDPIAIPTRLTPITISAANVARGQALDIKLAFKRDRAEGIGDTNALYGPPDAPEATISLDVKRTDASLNTLMQTGQTLGTDNGGTVAGDFFDPFAMTQNQLATTVPVVATLNDPRTAGVVLETITCPTSVFNTYGVSDGTKGPVTVKYSGKDKIGNITFAVTH